MIYLSNIAADTDRNRTYCSCAILALYLHLYLLKIHMKDWRSLLVRPGLTQVAEQRQQVCGVAEPQWGESEGHLGRKKRHGEVLDELSSQTLLQQCHVGGHLIRQEDEHADIVLHLDLGDLEQGKTFRRDLTHTLPAGQLRVEFKPIVVHFVKLVTCWWCFRVENTHDTAQIWVGPHLHRVVILLHHCNLCRCPTLHLEVLHCSTLTEPSHPLPCLQTEKSILSDVHASSAGSWISSEIEFGRKSSIIIYYFNIVCW